MYMTIMSAEKLPRRMYQPSDSREAGQVVQKLTKTTYPLFTSRF